MRSPSDIESLGMLRYYIQRVNKKRERERDKETKEQEIPNMWVKRPLYVEPLI